MKAFLKDKKGFTLVETSVAFLILMVVVALAGAMILSGMDIFARNSRLNTEKQVGDGIYNLVRDKLSYATHLKILEPGAENPYKEGITVQDGKLYYSNDKDVFEDLFGTEFYNGYRVELLVRDAQDSSIDLQVLIYREGESKAVYSTGAPIRLVNMGVAENFTEVEVPLQAKNPVLCFDYRDVVVDMSMDPIVKKMMGYTTDLMTRYSTLIKRYNEATTPEEKEAAKQAIRDAMNITESWSPVYPADAHYYTTLLKEYGGAWPAFDKAKLEVLNGTGGAERQDLFDSLSSQPLLVRAYYEMNEGVIEHTTIYAVSSASTPWAARLVYNDRTRAWYYYVKRTAGIIHFYNYSVTSLGAENFSHDDLMEELESGESAVGGRWVRLE